jgi:hypothetical protein
MSKNLESSELKRIKDIQDEYNQLIFNLGEYYFEKMQILEEFDSKESYFKDVKRDFDEKNLNLTQELSKKYGNGKIDLDKGTIETV